MKVTQRLSEVTGLLKEPARGLWPLSWVQTEPGPHVLDRNCPPRDRTRRLAVPSGLQGRLGQSGCT